METFATSGFELAALLAPELAGAVAGAGQGPRGDPRTPDGEAAPFALALTAVASTDPQAASLPASGKILPLFDRALVAAPAIDATKAYVADEVLLPPDVLLDSKPASNHELDAPSLRAVSPSAGFRPNAATADAAALLRAAPPAPVDPGEPDALPAAAILDTVAAKPVSTISDHAAQVVRLVGKQVEASDPRPTDDAPAQRLGEQGAGRVNAARELLQSQMPELVRQPTSPVDAAELTNPSVPPAITSQLRRLDGSAQISEPGVATPSVAAIAAEASPAQSVDAPKLTAELPAGNEARLPGALAERVYWMIDQNLGEARIKLNPPQLGAIDIKITMADDQTFVQFTASQAGAREIIESALPRLRDLLGAAGLEFGGATVGGEAKSHEQPEVRWSARPELEPIDVLEPVIHASRTADGRIDIYA